MNASLVSPTSVPCISPIINFLSFSVIIFPFVFSSSSSGIDQCIAVASPNVGKDQDELWMV